MAPPLVRCPPLAWLLLVSVLLLPGCSPWWQRQPASPDKLQQQCKALDRERQSLDQQRQADAQGLAAIAAEVYQPSPAPKAPDPDVASRYSQLDQQLDDERYNAELDAWRLREQQRRQRWLEGQTERRQRLQQRLNEHRLGLDALEPRLKACRDRG
jgi:hypothetical protein